MNQKIVLLAPHLKFPLHNGGDIYIDKLGCHLSLYRKPVFIVGTNMVVQYEKGTIVKSSNFFNDLRTKKWAALRTLIFKSHYLSERYLTNAYCQKARELVQENPEALVIYSLISTASLDLKKVPTIIITQNDEIAWFEDQYLFSVNPLQKLTAQISKKWIIEFLNHHARKFLFVHITENDYESYQRWMPGHSGFVVPAGVDIPKLSSNFSLDGNLRLLFVGSLGVKMNYDALIFFQKRFWPVLKQEFSEKIEIIVLGSRPSKQVRRLCQREGWQLFPDASDEELQLQYNRASFAILPFPYTSGVKLKLLNSLAVGLPVLATTNMCMMPHQEFFPNLYSDDPLKWRDHLRCFNTKDITLEQRNNCQKFASQYTWEKIAANMDRKLRELQM